ncbi:hypothetical protein Hypma_007247 [Hypsizygus marmoreus]|uniref:Uncharacterized protein n=1 Tax=Hypsizygus marmoreus TaxID=39966 RepID=A0A369KH31_HYPMA|nr:hypothetical protein Hypma_007247 [Hypsizygus marmoreus]
MTNGAIEIGGREFERSTMLTTPNVQLDTVTCVFLNSSSQSVNDELDVCRGQLAIANAYDPKLLSPPDSRQWYNYREPNYRVQVKAVR